MECRLVHKRHAMRCGETDVVKSETELTRSRLTLIDQVLLCCCAMNHDDEKKIKMEIDLKVMHALVK